MNTTEVLSTDPVTGRPSEWVAGPTLPDTVGVACAVALDDAETEHMVVADANYGLGADSRTWIYDWKTVDGSQPSTIPCQ